jgi:hypothetical protein
MKDGFGHIQEVMEKLLELMRKEGGPTERFCEYSAMFESLDIATKTLRQQVWMVGHEAWLLTDLP